MKYSMSVLFNKILGDSFSTGKSCHSLDSSKVTQKNWWLRYRLDRMACIPRRQRNFNKTPPGLLKNQHVAGAGTSPSPDQQRQHATIDSVAASHLDPAAVRTHLARS